VPKGTGKTIKRARKSLPPAVPYQPWLIEQLADPELAEAYLNFALAENDQRLFMHALRDVAKARGGISAIARHAGMNRVALSRALSPTGNPELHSLNRILNATGFRLMIANQPPKKAPAKRVRAEKKAA
jgi:probable addiction module antidote protein